MPRHRNILRREQNHFRGWVVTLKRRGKRYVRYFKDAGKRRAALQRAIAWRNTMIDTLPPPRRFHSRHATNDTGVVGVSYVRQHSRRGTEIWYYVASWTDENGRKRKRSFSVRKWGKARARVLAVQVRREVLARMLEPRKLSDSLR